MHAFMLAVWGVGWPVGRGAQAARSLVSCDYCLSLLLLLLPFSLRFPRDLGTTDYGQQNNSQQPTTVHTFLPPSSSSPLSSSPPSSSLLSPLSSPPRLSSFLSSLSLCPLSSPSPFPPPPPLPSSLFSLPFSPPTPYSLGLGVLVFPSSHQLRHRPWDTPSAVENWESKGPPTGCAIGCALGLLPLGCAIRHAP